MREIYLDNSATTKLCQSAKSAMTRAMEIYGNPSSLHTAGNAAKELLEQSRREVAATFGIRRPEPGELIFTGSGSEGDNLAVLGTALAKPRRAGGRIISTDSEHPGVENALKWLESRGFDVVRVPTKNGVPDLDFLRAALNEKTFLVTLMAVNNETGAAYPVAEAFSLVKAYRGDIVTHTDAVQAYLHAPLNIKTLGADLISVSAHKIHGPKGVGALYVSAEARKRKDLTPVIYGGGQEAGLRSGTENLVGIAGFAAAAKEGFANLSSNIAKMQSLCQFAQKKLDDLPVRVNLPAGDCAPHILSVTVPGIRSETLLHALSARGIFVSNGSACSSHAASPSPSLLAFGLTPQESSSTIRVSFSAENTEEDVCALADALREEIARLVHIR